MGAMAIFHLYIYHLRVLATVPDFEPAGFIGLRGTGLTTSQINDFLSKLPN
jgi:hypothetical protein